MRKELIEPAPVIEDIVPRLPSITKNMGQIAAALKWANEDYLYWDKFKHFPDQGDIDVKELWALLRLTRQSQLNQTPLKTTSGQNFGFWLPDRAQRLLHEFDLGTAGEISTEPGILNTSSRQQYIISSLMEEAIASSQIEGAATSRKIAKELLRTGRKPASIAEKMIVNNYSAIQKIVGMKNRQLTPEMLLDLQASLTEGTLSNPQDYGRFRTSDDVFVFHKFKQSILHEPPPARELPTRLALLCEFANSDKYDGRFIHPIVKAILLHFWLAYDHPFADGNGRTARALFYWYMLANGYWLFEHLSISKYILSARAQYERAYLYAEQDGADATYFIMFHLTVIEKALINLKAYIDRKKLEQNKVSFLLKGKSILNHRQQALIRHALSHPGFTYTIESHKNSNGVSYPTARYDLLNLAEQGLVLVDKSKRSWRFTAPQNLLERLS
ncbi:MAG: Fic family protein [Candidatus Aquicultorales bacterium]